MSDIFQIISEIIFFTNGNFRNCNNREYEIRENKLPKKNFAVSL